MKLTRRDLLIGTAGAAAGLVLSPVPWKLLGDVSIWTQNFPWIPQPAHGPVETKCSTCTLCEGGCGIRVRMAAKCPVGVAGVSSHPLTKGVLCPLAFAAHQLNWHPRRLREVRHTGRAASGSTKNAVLRALAGGNTMTAREVATATGLGRKRQGDLWKGAGRSGCLHAIAGALQPRTLRSSQLFVQLSFREPFSSTHLALTPDPFMS